MDGREGRRGREREIESESEREGGGKNVRMINFFFLRFFSGKNGLMG